eukprot:1235702-Rhodomonas_salina.3
MLPQVEELVPCNMRSYTLPMAESLSWYDMPLNLHNHLVCVAASRRAVRRTAALPQVTGASRTGLRILNAEHTRIHTRDNVQRANEHDQSDGLRAACWRRDLNRMSEVAREKEGEAPGMSYVRQLSTLSSSFSGSMGSSKTDSGTLLYKSRTQTL